MYLQFVLVLGGCAVWLGVYRCSERFLSIGLRNSHLVKRVQVLSMSFTLFFARDERSIFEPEKVGLNVTIPWVSLSCVSHCRAKRCLHSSIYQHFRRVSVSVKVFQLEAGTANASSASAYVKNWLLLTTYRK